MVRRGQIGKLPGGQRGKLPGGANGEGAIRGKGGKQLRSGGIAPFNP